MFRRILIVLDDDDPVEPVAGAISRYIGAEAQAEALEILAVAPPYPVSGANAILVEAARNAEEARRQDARAKAEAMKAALGGRGAVTVETGALPDLGRRAAERMGADLVVKPADREAGRHPGLFGGAEKKLIRHAPCPVMIVRPGAEGGIGVAIDHPAMAYPQTEAELMNASLTSHAARIAQQAGEATVELIHAWKPLGADAFDDPRVGIAPERIASYIDQWEDERKVWLVETAKEVGARHAAQGVTFVPHFQAGVPAEAIPAAVAKSALGLLVIGTANRKGLAGLFIGNTAEGLIDDLPSSILVIKPEGVGAILQSFANP